MRKVTMDDVNACIREYGLYGWSPSELRQLIREVSQGRDFSSQVRHVAARHVLVALLNRSRETDVSLTDGANATLLAEYTRLHDELAEMLSSGRLSQGTLKDDYFWLVDALERINAVRLTAGLRDVPFGSDDA